LESIRSRVDIAELVKDYVPQLARAGRSFKARCPFHQEHAPSFIVTPKRQTFHCFGCGASGDVFAFLMKMESLSSTEAAEKLAERAGVKIVKSGWITRLTQRLKVFEVAGGIKRFAEEVN